VEGGGTDNAFVKGIHVEITNNECSVMANGLFNAQDLLGQLDSKHALLSRGSAILADKMHSRKEDSGVFPYRHAPNRHPGAEGIRLTPHPMVDCEPRDNANLIRISGENVVVVATRRPERVQQVPIRNPAFRQEENVDIVLDYGSGDQRSKIAP
jgi:hypothetical protein